MCLDVIKTKENMIKWLNEKPELLVVYKVVKMRNGKYCPQFQNGESFFRKRTNVIKSKQHNPPELIVYSESNYWGPSLSYIPYFHLLTTLEGARKWRRDFPEKALWTVKCQVKKKDIVNVGRQNGCDVIVTKAFKILGEVK